jgi:hypothetical protein
MARIAYNLRRDIFLFLVRMSYQLDKSTFMGILGACITVSNLFHVISLYYSSSLELYPKFIVSRMRNGKTGRRTHYAHMPSEEVGPGRGSQDLLPHMLRITRASSDMCCGDNRSYSDILHRTRWAMATHADILNWLRRDSLILEFNGRMSK